MKVMGRAPSLLHSRGSRLARAFGVSLALLLSILAVLILVLRYGAFARYGLVGIDLEIYMGFAQRFVDTGSMYDPAQLAGPYDGQPYVSGPIPPDMPSLYPPSALLLFVPFLLLPAPLWWGIPVGITICAIVWLRPAWWSWPLIVALLATPDTAAGLVAGNTGMWLVAAMAGGVIWGWPALLVVIKPFLAPFALIGVGRRAWWIAIVVMLAVSLLMVEQWLDYPTVIANAHGWNYTLGNVPSMLAPIVAWLARRPRPSDVTSGGV